MLLLANKANKIVFVFAEMIFLLLSKHTFSYCFKMKRLPNITYCLKPEPFPKIYHQQISHSDFARKTFRWYIEVQTLSGTWILLEVWKEWNIKTSYFTRLCILRTYFLCRYFIENARKYVWLSPVLGDDYPKRMPRVTVGVAR